MVTWALCQTENRDLYKYYCSQSIKSVLSDQITSELNQKKNQMTTAVHKEGYNSFFYNLMMRKPWTP